MSEYKIGKVIGVSGDRIDISLLDNEADIANSGVPTGMVVNVQTKLGPVPVLIGQPGSFVKVTIPNGILLCMVTEIQMKEIAISTTAIKEAKEEEKYVIQLPRRIISTIPIGTLDGTDKFDRGTDFLPTVNSDVCAVLPETLDKIYESYADGVFSIGKLSLLEKQDAKINLDAFLTRHAAILGQTGGGKSWTVASLLQKIANFPKSTIILFDLHEEYNDTFVDYAEYIDASNLELPYWLMNSEELLGLMVDRTESAAPNQVASFKEKLQAAKEKHPENTALGIPKITIDTPVYFNFLGIIEEFRKLDTEMVTGASGKPIKGPLHGQFTRLLMRIDSRLNDRRYDLIFHPKIYNTSASMNALFKKLLGEEENPKKIIVINMRTIPFDVRTSVISLILRCLFDFAYWYKRTNDKTYPIAIFCDEAHLYLNDNDLSAEPSRKAAERIAKEGRKYGISLTVISQRPREVSATILSQCCTFLCLRITNPDDQSYVKNLLPDSIRGIVSMFSTLRRGEGILLGDSVIMPTRLKIDLPDPKPNSNDTSFYTEWNKTHTKINFDEVLDSWRKQDLA